MQILLYFMLKPGWLTDIKIQFLPFDQRLYQRAFHELSYDLNFR